MLEIPLFDRILHAARVTLPAWAALVVLSLLAAACGTLEVRIERTPTPDGASVATLVSLYLSGTQNAMIATQRAAEGYKMPTTGSASGKICYPGGNIPALHLYFLNTATNEIVDLDNPAGQAAFQVQLQNGNYIAYAWSETYQVGGLYSRSVLCSELNESCDEDHRPIPFEIVAGTELSGVDICDWAYPAKDLPLPAGVSLP